MPGESPEDQQPNRELPTSHPDRQRELQAEAFRRDMQVPLHPKFKSTEQLQSELQQRRDSGELHKDSVPLDYLKRNQPLCRGALMFEGKEQALVLTMPELCDVAAANPSRAFEFVNAAGDVDELEPFQARGSILILFPEDFGD